MWFLYWHGTIFETYWHDRIYWQNHTPRTHVGYALMMGHPCDVLGWGTP
jgi:hypothetical protein